MGRILLSSVFVLLLVSFADAKDATSPPPGSLVLLEGYQHRTYQKGALHDGAIWKTGGLQIKYDIGEGAQKKNESPVAVVVEWTVKQIINGRDLEVVKDKMGLVLACYPAKELEQTKSYPAIFSTTVKNEIQLAEFLAMVSTFPAPLKEQPRAENERPRYKRLENLRLVDGFRHERLQGRDSTPGRIFKDGLEIRYDIGTLAGNRAANREQEGLAWSLQQTINGRPVHMVLNKKKLFTVTFTTKETEKYDEVIGRSYPANFYGQVESEVQLAEFLLMTLTYPAFTPDPLAIPERNPANPLLKK